MIEVNIPPTKNPDFQDNVKIVRESASENGKRKYQIIDKEDNTVIETRFVAEQDGADIGVLIAEDYCEWIRTEKGSKIINRYFTNKAK